VIPTLKISALPADGSLSDEVWDADVLLALISSQRGRDSFGEVFLEDVGVDDPESEPETAFCSQLFADDWDLLASLCLVDGPEQKHASKPSGETPSLLSEVGCWLRSLVPVADPLGQR